MSIERIFECDLFMLAIIAKISNVSSFRNLNNLSGKRDCSVGRVFKGLKEQMIHVLTQKEQGM
jgi:hypothetical protein